MKQLCKFGERLRTFRKRRGMSQMDLALEAASTSRYISFIETGRSRPGRDIILRLATSLDLSLRESNILLESAGLNHEYQESAFDEELLKPTTRIVEMVLEKHNPYPAWSIGAGFQLIDSNQAAEKIYPGLVDLPPEVVVDLACAPSPNIEEEERIKNANQMIRTLQQEMFHYPHPDLPRLLERAKKYGSNINVKPENIDAPVLFGSLLVGGKKVQTITTIMRFDKAIDVTVSEVRIELVFPANEESSQILTDNYYC